jgi:ribonuclease P protein component
VHPSTIKKKREFQEVLARGRRMAGEYFHLILAPKGQPTNVRLGISLKRSVGSAVARNRSRRLVREAFRLHGHKLLPGTDAVAMIVRDLSPLKLKEVEERLCEMIGRVSPGASKGEGR